MGWDFQFIRPCFTDHMIFEAQFLRDNYQFLQVIAYVLGGG